MSFFAAAAGDCGATGRLHHVTARTVRGLRAVNGKEGTGVPSLVVQKTCRLCYRTTFIV